MLLKHNKYNNCTVLICLMEDGVLASFEIEHNYTDPNSFYNYNQYHEQIYDNQNQFSGQYRYQQDMMYSQRQSQSTTTTTSPPKTNIFVSLILWSFDRLTTITLLGFHIKPWSSYVNYTNSSFLLRLLLLIFDLISRILLIFTNLVFLVIATVIAKLVFQLFNSYFEIGSRLSDWWDSLVG